MLKILSSTMMALMMAMLLMTLSTLTSKKLMSDQEKSSPFECGFDPKSSPRMPFTIQFFLMGVLFLIFDIEIVIILPSILTLKKSMITTWMMTMALFISVLLMGLFHEWNNSMLEWTK